MNKSGGIRLLRNREIDFTKWDICVEKALSGKLYARAWFLDIVTKGWQALIFGDYEFVMPLPVRSKYGIKYVSQPTYCQQLGIYPNPPIEIQKQFAQTLRKSFWLINYQLNSQNDVFTFDGYRSTEKTNYILPLGNNYEKTFLNYAEHTRRNIKTSHRFNIQIKNGLLCADYLNMKSQATIPIFRKSDYKALKKLLSNSTTSGKGLVYAAYTPENNLCAAAFFILDGNRVYYLNSFSNEQGRKNMAMYSIIDEVIKEFSGTGLILDFEGSVIDGIAWFFKGFGAIAEKYFYIYSNRIPFVRKFMT